MIAVLYESDLPTVSPAVTDQVLDELEEAVRAETVYKCKSFIEDFGSTQDADVAICKFQSLQAEGPLVFKYVQSTFQAVNPDLADLMDKQMEIPIEGQSGIETSQCTLFQT